MKALILSISLFAGSVAFGGNRYMGQVGPFDQDQLSTQSLKFKKCVEGVRELQFFAHKSGKYHMPRVKVEWLTVEYSSGFQDQIDGRSVGVVKNFETETEVNQGCVRSVTMRAEGKGFRPSGSQPEYIEVWGN